MAEYAELIDQLENAANHTVRAEVLKRLAGEAAEALEKTTAELDEYKAELARMDEVDDRLIEERDEALTRIARAREVLDRNADVPWIGHQTERIELRHIFSEEDH